MRIKIFEILFNICFIGMYVCFGMFLIAACGLPIPLNPTELMIAICICGAGTILTGVPANV